MGQVKLKEAIIQRVVEELVAEIKEELRGDVKTLLVDARPSKAAFSRRSKAITHKIEPKKSTGLPRRSAKEQFSMKSYDKKKFNLGELCENGHNWQKTGQSLRYLSNCKCILCQHEYNAKRRGIAELKNIRRKRDVPSNELVDAEKALGIDRKTHKLGPLCDKRHSYEDTGFSLRYKVSGRCTVCNKDYNRNYWRKRRKEEKKQQAA